MRQARLPPHPWSLLALISITSAVSAVGCVGADLDGICDATHCASPTSKDTPKNERAPPILINPESSILDFLDPKLLDEEVLSDFKSSITSGKVVVIQDAFKVEFAEYVWEHVSRDDVKWTHGLANAGNIFSLKEGDDRERINAVVNSSHARFQRFNPGNAGHNTSKKSIDKNNLPPVLDALMGVFNHTSTRDFMTSISGRSCSGRPASYVTEYGYGDYSTPHNDFRGRHSLQYVWNLSKDWDPAWGGSFFWGDSKSLEGGYSHPTFNTLILFLPTMYTTHVVTPVSHLAKGRRLSIKGGFISGEDNAASVDQPIEQVYSEKDNLFRLTFEEALRFSQDLNPHGYTDDTTRHQGLRDLMGVVALYLDPKNEQTYEISWSDENEEDQIGADATDVTEDEDISITFESSIVDFLDPSIFEDTELLSEVRSSLREGKLVVIRDAFREEFAEYAWKHLSDDNIIWHDWSVSEVELGDVGTRHFADKPSHSPELISLLGIFEHSKTKEFFETISGRPCSGPVETMPTWYKQGDYSSPHIGTGSFQYLWFLAKDWDPTYGGALYWFPSSTIDEGYNHPSFNTLLMSLPTPSSVQMVTPVTWWADGKHLSINGSYQADDSEF